MEAVLHVVSDSRRHRLPLLQALLEGAKGGADVLQIRAKEAPALEVYRLCEELLTACQQTGSAARVIVNDRVDVAMAVGAWGVHLAQTSVPVQAVSDLRRKFHWRGAIGCSAHSLAEALDAYQNGADYVTFGHVFTSVSHPGQAPRGVRELARVVDALDIPVIAIGGIDATNVAAVLQTGCSGVAVIGAVLDQADPRLAAQSLKAQMVKAAAVPKVPFYKKG